MSERRHGCQLYLIIEATGAAGDLARLEAALQAGPIPALLIVSPVDKALDAATARPLVARAQSAGVAALISDSAQLARTLRADGVHLSAAEGDFAEARDILGNRYMIGVDVEASRHEAMEAGEAGADYVAFSVPPGTGDDAGGREERLALIAWWAEIFVLPCVALDVATPDEAAALAAAGADFVAVRLTVAQPPDEIRRQIAAFQAAISGALTEA